MRTRKASKPHNVSGRIIGDLLIGLYVLPECLEEGIHWIFLQEVLTDLMENVPPVNLVYDTPFDCQEKQITRLTDANKQVQNMPEILHDVY
ncbi:hypothetical protein TNIN_285711 [Trichonephila inaurata madagascariensis]|uniref:Uncharacterized protein n=1 Tax=Trichonephila inaurata madagascariensis TaxID=2747483 RepID=A0A8X6XP23_9ARAC|nr:hypothetical protein TNIN_326311 [Trichonephila inaurata madagascariensis]GFY67657.1 hypothetical protein TNIN_285711 [Trichonephila inaurata madagascariensis]